MQEEIMIIAVVSIIAGTLMIASIIKSIFGYAKSRNQQGSAPGSSLTTSELERLVRTAVEEATEPLHAKIDRLEARLDETPLLEAASREPPLHELEDADEVTLKAGIRNVTRPSAR